MVNSVDEIRSLRSIRRITPFPYFESLDARIATSLNKIIQNSNFKKKNILEEQKGSKSRPTPSRKTDRLPDLRVLTNYKPIKRLKITKNPQPSRTATLDCTWPQEQMRGAPSTRSNSRFLKWHRRTTSGVHQQRAKVHSHTMQELVQTVAPNDNQKSPMCQSE